MMNRFFTLMIAGLLLGLYGCSGAPTRDAGRVPEQAPATPSASPPVEQRTEQAQPPISALNADVMYALLVAEIALQREQKEMAANHYKLAARLSRDARTAERAARIAVYLDRVEAAAEALELWVDLEPENTAAHQVAAAFYGQQRDTDRAVEHLRELVRLSEGQRLQGFMQAAGVAGKLKDRGYGLELMRQLVSGYGENPDALYAYAVVAAGAGSYVDAEASVRQVLRLQPEWAEANVLLSRILARKGDQRGALAVLRQAVQTQPDNLLLRIAYARRLVEEHDLEQAYDQFQVILEQQADNPEALFSAGILALQLKDIDAARRYLSRLADQDVKRAEVAYYLGQIEEMDGRYEEAIDWYEQVSGAYRMDAEVRQARLLAKLGKLVQAREIMQGLRVQEPDQAIKLLLIEGEIVREAGGEQEAMRLYDEALKSFPDNPELLYTRALFAAELGRIDILEADLRRVIEDNPNNADALNALGYTLADQTDRYQEALHYIERALELKPDNAAILDSMGWVQYRLGDYDRALLFLRKAMQKLPDEEIAAHLGEVLWVMGRKQEARRVWEEGLKQEPDSERLQRLLSDGVQAR